MELIQTQTASYDAWNPKDYLSEYYSEILPDERFTLEFLVETVRKLSPVSLSLDFGSGPVIPHIFPLIPKTEEIHMSEFVSSNRRELEKWLKNDPEAHNWRDFTLETLTCEGVNPTNYNAHQREQEARRVVTKILSGDVTSSDPIGPISRGCYPLVSALYCAEAVSSNHQIWHNNIKNIMSLVKPGGTLILAACGLCDYYQVGKNRFPCTRIEPQDMLSILYSNDFTNIDLRVRQLHDQVTQGLSLTILAAAVKPE